MKNPKRPTREQKVIIASKGLDPEAYLTVSDEEKLKVISKVDGSIKELEKPERPERRSRRWK